MDNDDLVLGTVLEEESDRTDTIDTTDRGLIDEISNAMGLGTASDRARRRKQKLREALVREHIQERELNKSRLATLIGRSVKRG